MIPSKAFASLVGYQIATKQAAPAQVEYRPFGFLQGHESITGVTDGIGRSRPQPCQPVGEALAFLDQDVSASKGLAAHPIKHALQLGAMSAVWLRAKFLRQTRNILTKFVHAAPFDNPVPLDYERS